jgi:hypothetical protein
MSKIQAQNWIMFEYFEPNKMIFNLLYKKWPADADH